VYTNMVLKNMFPKEDIYIYIHEENQQQQQFIFETSEFGLSAGTNVKPSEVTGPPPPAVLFITRIRPN
jgi:hypothetical protein